ncbi:hypothetical protein A1Q2_07778 [Trichosporon asahii var. asahii CBS 8904]|uniref:Uncharacterized protein n=1 Tax=Trichosporon asahii var. asahii (strain CBS 8904) TaxID=1220162 RepID=K1VFX8_TRIAC|nr:hypothetical protein A1Q2_07778 [Trichosporon asahii var. asahii CBS 8904]
MRDHPVKTPAEWPGVLKTPGATDWPGSLNPFEGEFALYDMLKFRSSVDYTASRKSSGVVPEEVASAVESLSNSGPSSSPSAQSDSTYRTPSTHRSTSTHHVSFASAGSSPTMETPTASSVLSAAPAKPFYKHPFAVPDPRGDPKVHERMELDRPHPFSLAEGIARSLSAPPPPAPPPPTRAPSIVSSIRSGRSRLGSRDDTDIHMEHMEQRRKAERDEFGKHHHHLDALLKAKRMSGRPPSGALWSGWEWVALLAIVEERFEHTLGARRSDNAVNELRSGQSDTVPQASAVQIQSR